MMDKAQLQQLEGAYTDGRAGLVNTFTLFLNEPNVNFQREACGILAELVQVSSFQSTLFIK